MSTRVTETPFGVLLREWRGQHGVSQLELAGRASSTPRHISFLETGRSRPRRSMVLKISHALGLPPRECNTLLRAAGLAAEYSEYGLEAEDLRPYRAAIDALLDSHEPFPACVVDRWGQILRFNEAFEALSPGAHALTPEQFVDATFGSEEARSRLLNWEEVAWSYVDRMSTVARRLSDIRIEALVDRVRGHLGDAERPPATAGPHIAVTLALDGVTLRTFTTFLRFENARDVTLSELIVELIFPVDDDTRRYFEAQAE